MSTTDWSLSSLDEFEEPDPSKVAIETVLNDHSYELGSGTAGTRICSCGHLADKRGDAPLQDAFRAHLSDVLWQMRPHTCEPGEVIWKFDGGRGALLCPTCSRIVGYRREFGKGRD